MIRPTYRTPSETPIVIVNNPSTVTSGVDWMGVLGLIFSWPGAVIAVCLTLTLISVFILSSKKFRRTAAKALDGDYRFKRGDIELSRRSPRPQDATEEPDLVEPEARTSLPTTTETIEKVESNDPELDLEKQQPWYWHHKMWEASEKRDFDLLEEALNRYKALETREMSDQEIDSLALFFRAQMQDDTALRKLEELEQHNPDWTAPSFRLAHYYSGIKSNEKALRHIEIGMARARPDSKKVRFLKLRTEILVSENRARGELEALFKFCGQLDDSNAKASVFEIIADIYKSLNDNFRMQRSLEQSLALQPEDTKRRFVLALSYGEDEKTWPLAYYHYEILTRQNERFDGALNNMAIIVDKYGMTGYQIKLWKRASAFGHVMSIGNLAFKLAEHGFHDEAKSYLAMLPGYERHSGRPLGAAQRIDRRQRDEQELLQRLETFSQREYQLMLQDREFLGTEISQRSSKDLIEGVWRDDAGRGFEIKAIDQAKLAGEVKTNSLVYKLSGNRMDCTIFLELELAGSSGPRGLLSATLLGSPPKEKIYLRLVVQNPEEVTGIEFHNNGKPYFAEITLKKQHAT